MLARKSQLGLVAFGAVALLSCGGSTTTPPSGTVCGDTRCSAGQVCCIDCGGRGSCGAPGLVCAGYLCTRDGGTDGGGGTACAQTTCASGQICCIDCNGVGTCGQPGTACPGTACMGTPCGPILCSSGEHCCCDSRCVPMGALCTTCDDAGGCGLSNEPCCPDPTGGGSCTMGLVCCTGVPYPQGGTCLAGCTAVSDRAQKQDFSDVDSAEVLRRLTSIPVQTWSYRADALSVRHMGPMAQDFHAAFGLGSSDKRIDMVDANGVLVAAVQALDRNVISLRAEQAELRRQNAALEREIARLRSR